MNTNERLTKFQDELSQRKHLLNNRITILKSNSSATNTNRIDQLQTEKQTIQEIQELFFDYFYNELTTSTDEVAVTEKTSSIKVEDLIAQADKKKNISNEIIRQSINQNNNDQAQEREPEAEVRKKPNMASLIGKLDQIRNKHSND